MDISLQVERRGIENKYYFLNRKQQLTLKQLREA